MVVVFPWLPATATPYFKRISSASISARGITGTPRRRASTTSALSECTAVEQTATCAPSTCSARCPSKTRAPSEESRSVVAERFRSDPETA